MKINNEPAYPIYSFSAKWTEDGEQDPKYPKWFEGLSEGRIHNSTGNRKMFKQELSDGELMIITDEYINSIKNSRQNKNIDNLVIDVKLWGYETWCLDWFQHFTFDTGQTNQEALSSFSDYVYRHRNDESILLDSFKDDTIDKSKLVSLMGAEDQWRWHGAEPNGNKDDHSEAPCRCKFCKELGIIRIAH